jgi:hypothetical protein
MDKFIVELPNFIPPKLCEQIINRFESDDKKTVGFMRYHMGDDTITERLKYNEELNISAYENWKDISSDLRIFMEQAILEYFKHIKDNFNYDQKYHTLDRILSLINIEHDMYLVQKIKRGDYFPWHIDGVIGTKFFVQIIIYLNTLNIEDGGRTEFSNGRSIKPEIGKVLIFPCSWTFPHRGTKVKCDYKYICTLHINAEDVIAPDC